MDPDTLAKIAFLPIFIFATMIESLYEFLKWVQSKPKYLWIVGAKENFQLRASEIMEQVKLPLTVVLEEKNQELVDHFRDDRVIFKISDIPSFIEHYNFKEDDIVLIDLSQFGKTEVVKKDAKINLRYATDRSCKDKGFNFDDIEEVGDGGQGTVYLIRNEFDDRKYIYKMYERPRSFWRETLVLSEFDHPFIIKPICINIEKLGVVLPFLEQGDLTKMPRNVTTKQVKKFMAQMIVGVHELHKHGYVHADLKTGNVGRTLYPYDHIVLLDFGLAMPTNNITLDVGTESMMAPEMSYPEVFPNEVHEGVDWWCMGATFWQIHSKIHRLKTTFPKDDIIPVNDTMIVSKWKFPDEFEYSLRDLIMKLMPLDSDLRKFGPDRIEKILGHPYFHDFDWGTLMQND